MKANQYDTPPRMIDGSVIYCGVIYSAGSTLNVIWGKWGYIPTQIAKITPQGSIYVKRWIRSRDRWSSARRLQWRNQRYYVI